MEAQVNKIKREDAVPYLHLHPAEAAENLENPGDINDWRDLHPPLDDH